MKLKFIFTIILINYCLNCCHAQGKKNIKDNKIKSVTEYITLAENGKESTYKFFYSAFNRKAEVIEEIEYNNNGTIKNKKTTLYDPNDNKIEETYFHKKDKKVSKTSSDQSDNTHLKTVYKYNVHNDRTEAEEIDLNNPNLTKKHLFFYNRKGEKDLEETYNVDKKLIKKHTYLYNIKGLKVEKKTFNENNILETTKRYVYEFY